MMLPRILVIDDQLAASQEARQAFCDAMRARDLESGEDGVEPLLAEVKIIAGQRRVGDSVENDLEVVLREIEAGWPFPDGGRWALLLLDLQFVSGKLQSGRSLPVGSPGDNEFGSRILSAMAERWPGNSDMGYSELAAVPTVIFSVLDRGEAEQQCNRLGALGYIARGLGENERRREFAHMLYLHGLIEDGALRRVEALGEIVDYAREKLLIGRSLPLLRALRLARRVSYLPQGKPVLRGESGTGKELVARYIHDLTRGGRPFHASDLNATPETLVESHLFGVAPGAFTGATRQGQMSLMELAADGTLFLDEIGNLSGEAARKLLRVMQDGEFVRVGGTRSLRSECGFVTATNKNIESMVAAGSYPGDLILRLSSPHIWLPPLRERGEDVDFLFDSLLRAELLHTGGNADKEVQPEVYERLRSYPWEGNVRSLEDVVRWIAVMRRDSTTVEEHDVLASVQAVEKKPILQPGLAGTRDATPSTGGFRAVLQRVDSAAVPTTYSELSGSLELARESWAKLIVRLLAAAGEETRNRATGEINKTGSVCCIVGRKVSPTEAKRLILRLESQFEISRVNDPIVGEFIEWVRKDRAPE